MFFLIFCLFLFAGCQENENASQHNTPSWLRSMLPLSGTNLLKLEPSDRFENFVSNTQFENNLTKMKWNLYRLPLEWEDYTTETGTLDSNHITKGIQNFDLLIEKLRAVHNGLSQPIFLIVDFHQYKFGNVCGGVGIPKNAIDESGIDKEDPNCIFLAFNRFWKNSHNVQDKWFEFSKPFLEHIALTLEENKDWLVIGIEPINEPQFGTDSKIFLDSIIRTYFHMRRFTKDRRIQKQITENLLPFYKRYLNHMKEIEGAEILFKNAVFIMEPFLLDYVHLPIKYGPFNVEITTDGNYSSFRSLQNLEGVSEPLKWIAAPHHYLGAQDDGFISFLPDFLKTELDHYPNSIFNKTSITTRVAHVKRRMAEAGMPVIFGEWGTQTGLKNPDGSWGGHKQWIADSIEAFKRSAHAWIWWQYYPDPSPNQDSFYLLVGRWGNQDLKCAGDEDLVPLVFGGCGESAGIKDRK